MPIEVVGSFQVKSLRVLDEHGNLDEALEPKLSEEQLVRLYRTMWLAREADQRMLKLQRQGRIGTFGPCTGQEAPPAATALAMTDRDWFVSAFREFSGWLMRGVPVANNYIFHNGWEEGNLAPRAHRTLPINIIVGSQAPHAVGIAYAMKLRGEKDSAVAVFFGDGATSQGELHEALNFAAVTKDVYSKEGPRLVKSIVETRVAKYELKFLREQKKRLKAELDEVQALIDQAVTLKVDEAEEVAPGIEKPLP